MSWVIIQTDDGVSVMPWNDVHERPAYGHTIEPTCWCQPRRTVDAPLSIPLWTHHEPNWPGADPEASRTN